ncbi:hypothetical protein ABW19_dt0208807 [Dactylella cylindrospora]|nr:hypothetical protein ABW19_dt0208807 [Dactylella cylindrospora]
MVEYYFGSAVWIRTTEKMVVEILKAWPITLKAAIIAANDSDQLGHIIEVKENEDRYDYLKQLGRSDTVQDVPWNEEIAYVKGFTIVWEPIEDTELPEYHPRLNSNLKPMYDIDIDKRGIPSAEPVSKFDADYIADTSIQTSGPEGCKSAPWLKGGDINPETQFNRPHLDGEEKEIQLWIFMIAKGHEKDPELENIKAHIRKLGDDASEEDWAEVSTGGYMWFQLKTPRWRAIQIMEQWGGSKPVS